MKYISEIENVSKSFKYFFYLFKERRLNIESLTAVCQPGQNFHAHLTHASITVCSWNCLQELYILIKYVRKFLQKSAKSKNYVTPSTNMNPPGRFSL